MSDRGESDQLPEEGPSGQVPEDEGGAGEERGEASDSAGVPGGAGQDEDGQASGNPGGAG